MSYDANGNIQMLQRTGEYEDAVQSLQIDNLQYFYHSTRKNQLMKVTDLANNPNGFKDDSDGTNDTADDYAYDEFGNMNRDFNKGITNIRYNHLNLPTLVEFGANGKIEYLYNAAGVKLQKKVSSSIVTTTDYLNGFQYVKAGTAAVQLEFFPHAEGYVKVSGGNQFNYVYNYTDHLGNVRLSYTKDPATNVLTILEENHYYPFGLKHNNYNMTNRQYTRLIGGGVIISPVDKNTYKYKLNGKEYQDELGLNMYAMDMRQYDPAIARWVVQDPVVHHNYSPYSAFDNNPVFWSDPSGADSNTPEMFDGLGRNKFDSNGLYIPMHERGDEDLGMIGYMNEKRRKSGMGAAKQFVLPSGELDFFAPGKEGTSEVFRIYGEDGKTVHVFYESFFGDSLIYPNNDYFESSINSARCPTCLNPSTIGNNFFNLTYPGGDNPRSYNGDYNYSYVPKNLAEYPAIGHDRRYDNLGISGKAGLFVDTRAIGADWRFVAEEMVIMSNPMVNPLHRVTAGLLGAGLGLCALPKTVIGLSTQVGRMKAAINYGKSNIGVNNAPTIINN